MSKIILLLDDSRTVREVLKVYLMGRGFSFLEAEDGERALDLLRAGGVDLVLADINVPKLDGLAFLRAARGSSQRAERRVLVVLITADKSVAEKQRSKIALADALLFKPIQREELLRVVSDLLGGRAP
jgi:two-component system chemotaxis response regulator CheY